MGELVNQETLCSAVPQTVVGHRVSAGLNKGSLVLAALLRHILHRMYRIGPYKNARQKVQTGSQRHDKFYSYRRRPKIRPRSTIFQGVGV